MAAQIRPHDSVVIVDIVDDKNVEPKTSTAGSSSPANALCVCGSNLARAWHELRCLPRAFILTMTASSVLCLLPAATVAGFLDVETVTRLGRVAVFVAIYVGTWLVVARVYKWLNTSY